MAKFLVNGGRALEGEISVSGSKNASLPALAASLLFSDAPPLFQNLPEIEDIKRMKELLQSQKDGRFDYEVAKKIRASILAVGPALARFGRSSFPHPGGCVIGARPIDVFFDGWKAMGAIVEKTPPSGKKPGFLAVSKPGFEELGGVHSIPIYEIRAPQGLRGCDFTFRVPSVTGTEGLMMTAVLAQGRTILRNVAEEPEILSLADWLNKNGAKIGGAGTHTITIEGRGGKLLSGQVPFLAPPDRIESLATRASSPVPANPGAACRPAAGASTSMEAVSLSLPAVALPARPSLMAATASPFCVRIPDTSSSSSPPPQAVSAASRATARSEPAM